MTESITLTLDVATRKRLDSLVEVFRAEFSALGIGELTRTAVLREALAQGLMVLERQVRAGVKPLTASIAPAEIGQAEAPRTESVVDRIVRAPDGVWFCVWIERDLTTGGHRVVASPFRSSEGGGLDTLEDVMPDGALAWNTRELLSAAAAQAVFEDWVHRLEKTVG
ncbi:MAG: hypothetical protein U1F42_09035 [Candidatus Competibacteraceae bacterium]